MRAVGYFWLGVCVLAIFMIGYCAGSIKALKEAESDIDYLEKLVSDFMTFCKNYYGIPLKEYEHWHDLIIGEESEDGEG